MQLNVLKDFFITSTDTIVGIGAPVSNKNKDIIFKLKKRNINKQLVIMIDSIETARQLPEWNLKAENYAKQYWPGNTTLVISNNLALRVPNNLALQNLLQKLGPCYVTSANISNEAPLSFEDAKKTFKCINKYYDFGNGSGIPSTIIDINTNKILRE